MEFSLPRALPAYEEAARALRARRVSRDAPEDWARAAIEAVREISGQIEGKKPLRELRATRDLLPAVAAGALAEPVTRDASLQPTEREVLEMLLTVF